jgi:glutathione S-transferase
MSGARVREEVKVTGLRIFSYLPNPRVWKATIAARFCGVAVEIRGASPKELRDWLWDYDARPLAEQERQSLSSLARTGRVGLTGAKLFKTDAFLEAQPFGNVPAAFGPDGKIGIFESNSIMRAVARLGETTSPLYGRDAWEASRIDSFLDVSLLFARDSQIYLLALSDGTVDAAIHARAKQAFAIYASGLEQALSAQRKTLVGDDISLADVCFAAELALFMNEYGRVAKLNERSLDRILHAGVRNDYPLVFAHFDRLVDHEHFRPDLKPYVEKLLSRVAGSGGS